ncbi:Fic family protein [Methanomethylophilus alvi]|uniref:Fic family protein n=1 Tax=Methanomethylophilus alvi TaxID=1291540 RepID=UPI0037DBF21A
MDESDFIGTKTGEVRWSMYGEYCYFHPHDLPFDHDYSPEVISAMTDASIEIARLDGMLGLVDDSTVEMLSRNLSLMESTSSSSIEGTRSTVDDVFRSEKEEEKNESIIRDNQEITNYRKALIQGFDELPAGGRFDIEIIKRLHRTLMAGVRGSDKSPGEFKVHQNAIGMASDTLETAKMVPASPESVDHLIDNWLEYVNSDSLNTVEKMAMAHYQFEAIHPFRDGNGRVGRLLSLMILRRDGLLKYPILYISGHLNSRRSEYMDLMYRVSSRDSIDEWLTFFSEGLCIQAKSAAKTVEALIRYRKRLTDAAEDLKETKVVEMLFRNPYITSRNIVEELDISVPTANKILDRFQSEGILREVTGKRRNRLYCAEGIIDILR